MVVVVVVVGEGEEREYSYDASMCSSPAEHVVRSAPIIAKNAVFITISMRYVD